jgi:hypothetical protein
MSEEARLDLSKVTIPEAVKNYSPEKRQEVMDYLSEMDEQHRQAYEIALNHLESSFDIVRSNGFQDWKKSRVTK